MATVHNSVDTVNAAATAIVTAQSRVQPSTKRRWGSWWSLYWCFGSHRQSKRIGHAVLVSEPTPQNTLAPISENPNRSSTIVLPFIAPPSSPTSFLQSEPPSTTHSPAGLLSMSVHAYTQGGTQPMFTIGPYAHETQLVSPPVFSTFTTEPSTASFTPPPEPVQMTTPSSPEVPFAQLLSSSLAQNRRKYQPYIYPGSPGGSHIKSPGSAVSTSGNSSPFPDKRPVIEFRMAEAPKFIGYEHFISNYKWGSRVGSGSLTPNGGLSRLGSGTLTPNGVEPVSRDGNLLESQISEVASLANSDHELGNDGVVVDHRVSFELIGEDIPTCVIREAVPSHKTSEGSSNQKDLMNSCREQHGDGETVNKAVGMALDGAGDEYHHKHRTVSLGSSKDFNFNNAKGEISDKSSIDCEWWTSDKVVSKELDHQKNWTFFPMLQSGVS
ncbi:hypothetical protein BUALT_Bualt06G0108000 [Buddleja alternifolia]|uniref:Hydroxyproline-rich glycoprotein family protein n=1 Tax=Buddleja alternifolia TaxID=168488 RepID=A0AAV6XE83_9LAMI|nr:hypothetical protein BUALT_Bualt06G0108000 [Buddleja alternifolia]